MTFARKTAQPLRIKRGILRSRQPRYPITPITSSVPRFDLKGSSPNYRSITAFLQQDYPDYCTHEGLCTEQTSCACALNKTTCRPACTCGSLCPRQFPRCHCEGSCNSSCPCVSLQRECILEGCSCINCENIFQRVPKLTVSKSTIQGAGKGLFAAEAIKQGAFIGEYQGKRCCDTDQRGPTDGRVVHFRISKSTSIDGSSSGNATFYINHPNEDKDRNAKFIYVEGPNRRRIIAIATEDITTGQEIFADYGRQGSPWTFPSSPPSGQRTRQTRSSAAPTPSPSENDQSITTLRKQVEGSTRTGLYSHNEKHLPSVSIQALGPPPVVPEDNQYSVECLLERRERRLSARHRKRVVQYLVRWKGWGEEHDGWVDEIDIHEDLIKAFVGSTTDRPT